MTEHYIALIQKTWMTVSMKDTNLAHCFYDKLFHDYPETRQYFDGNIEKQAEKLTYTLGYIVVNLTRLDKIKESVEQLGKLHSKAYNIKPEDYGKVKEALIYALSEKVSAWDEEFEKAWRWAIDALAGIMINHPE